MRAYDNLPQAVLWQGAWQPITHIALSWQVDVQWWKQRIYRDYHKVLTDQGILLVMYHDLLTDTWALQRVYD